MRFTLPVALALAVAPAMGAAAPARPVVAVRDMAGLRAELGKARPGTIIELAPGTYSGGLHQSGLRGEPNAPIVIRSAQRDAPALFTDTIQLSDPVHLAIEGIAIKGARGNGLNIDDGGTFETFARCVALRGLRVEEVGPQGNLDGIKLSGVQDFLIEGCTVRRWGSGGSAIDMVGCHRGLIAGCTFIDEDARAANAVQAKGGSSDVVVRRCVFEHAGTRAVNIGGSTGEPYFRPQGADYECRGMIVLGNHFVGSQAPIAFVSSDRAQALYNTILWPRTWVFRILQEKPVPQYIPCREGTFAHNVIVWRSGDVRAVVNIGPNTKPESFHFASNVWYASDAPARSTPSLPAPEKGGAYGKEPAGVLAKDAQPFAPAPPGLAAGAGAPGEREVWEKVARPLVPWAAGQCGAAELR